MPRDRVPLLKREEGQSLVEMALVLPLLLMLLFGIVEFGRVGHTYFTLHYAAREGARIGITGSTDQVIIDRIHNVAPGLDSERLTINLSPSFDSREIGDEMAVTLDYPVELYLPMVEILVPNPLPLSGRAVMRME